VLVHLGPKGRDLRQVAIEIPQTLIRDNHLDETEVRRTKVLVDQILTKFLECSQELEHS
jgi:hypothetical protein